MYFVFACFTLTLVVNALPAAPKDVIGSHSIQIVANTSQDQEPEFVKLCKPADLQEFLRIINNLSLTEEALEKEFNGWLAKQPANVKSAYEKFKEHWEKVDKSIKSNYPSSKLSKAAKDAINEFDAVVNDKSLTVQQQLEKGWKIYDALPAKDKTELQAFLQSEIEKVL